MCQLLLRLHTPNCFVAAALHGLAPDDIQGRLSTFLKHQLSVALVLDVGLGSALALTEAAAEFVKRWAGQQNRV